MKCIMSVDGKHIQRVTEDRARKLYLEGWRYIPKSVWKEKVRDVKKSAEEKPPIGKNNKISKATKRHLRKANK